MTAFWIGFAATTLIAVSLMAYAGARMEANELRGVAHRACDRLDEALELVQQYQFRERDLVLTANTLVTAINHQRAGRYDDAESLLEEWLA